MIYKPEYIMTFGRNKGYSLGTIYHYKPTYLQFLVKFIDGFEIEVKDFEDLPNPTITDPDRLPTGEKIGGLRFYPAIKLETSVRIIMEYIKNGGKFREINFAFSQEILDILDLKRKGEYIVPKYEDRNNI